MSEQKHTAGPWEAVEHYSDAVSVVDARGFEIVEAASTAILLDYANKLGIDHWAHREGEAFIDLDEDEQAANARLIAAAPDLLEAALALTGQHEHDIDHDEALEMLERAIAKATDTA